MYNLTIICGKSENGIQKKAIEVLSEFLLDYSFEYPICLKYCAACDYSQYRCVFTLVQNNDYIKEHSKAKLDKKVQK